MRRSFVIGLCALHLAFGFVAGQAHTHGSGHHHDSARGLHLDHAHFDGAQGSHGHGDHAHDHEAERHESRSSNTLGTHEHANDALPLSHEAVRAQPELRVAPLAINERPRIQTASVLREQASEIASRRGSSTESKSPPRWRPPPA